MNQKPKKFPILRLLLLSMAYTPFGILLMVLWAAMIFATVALPVFGLILLWTGDYLIGIATILSGFASFFVARLMKKRFWETPPSLL